MEDIKKYFKVGDSDISKERIRKIEAELNIKFPQVYVNFITEFKCGFWKRDEFQLYLEKTGCKLNGIYHEKEIVAELETFTKNIVNIDFHKDNAKECLLPKSLIFFASDGAGRYFCFDFDKEKDGKVPIILIMPDADEETRGRYIADDFEQFLEMIGNPNLAAPYYHVPYYDVEEE